MATMPRVVFLDTLRFIAAGAVLFQHVAEKESGFGQWIVGMLSPGVFGVVLFFIVSGFVIPMTAGRRFDLKTFMIRRVFRIYPLVFAAFALMALLGYCTAIPDFSAVKSATLGDWLANLLLIQDYVGATPLLGVTWTLSIEFAWYAIFAVALLSLGRKFDDKLAIAAPLVMLALVGISLVIGHRLPLGRIGMIYAAILGCRAFRTQAGELPLTRLLVDTGVFVVIMALSNIVSFGYFSHPNITMNQSLFPWLVAPIVFVLVAGIPSIRRSALVDNRITGWLGSVSYSTYLLHPFAIGLAGALVPSSLFAVVSVLFALFFAVLGYRLIELPGQALGKRIIARAG
ncbi:acyltransferase family protein [Labrys sp. La1]|uniref:acyltransferase family protein n=1 Tax=Labrys sp. La1 TaxID=3404917 RepID=UPI003EBE423A